jgi:hypothetical protein
VVFSKLNDAGLFGVCEGDLNSTITQLLVTSLAGVPGFVSDPVFDTSRNEVIHAHCVAATALAGLKGPRSPYILRSHMEDNKGVSMQVLAPASGTVTVGKFAAAAKFLVSTAEVIGTEDNPRGCRTKIRTRVPNARKFLEVYSAGLHRVVFYGDHTAAIERFSRLNGVQVVREVLGPGTPGLYRQAVTVDSAATPFTVRVRMSASKYGTTVEGAVGERVIDSVANLTQNRCTTPRCWRAWWAARSSAIPPRRSRPASAMTAAGGSRPST